jgi:carbon-monoxide dehydrogenase large subunit
MTGDHIGRSLRRLEDERFLTGQGRYVDDIAVPGQQHGVVLRSSHGHALIEGIDTAAARAIPGVHGVFTAADLDAEGIGTLPCIAQVATVAPMIVPPRRALARDRVRHVGDPVAFVVAETTQQARDAAERVAVTYRPLPAVVDAIEALAAQAPLLWDAAPGNLSYRFERGDNRWSRRRSRQLPTSSRSSWSTTGWSWLRSSRAPRSAPTMPPPTASTCC